MSAPLTVADVLERAADLIEPEGAWTQGAFARRANGRMTLVKSSDAVCFCLRGALVKVGAIDQFADSSLATIALGFKTAKRMVDWNDRVRRTQAEVVAKLREAAAIARGAPTPLDTPHP